MKKSSTLMVFALAAAAPVSPVVAQFSGGSFETQAPTEIAANPGYCYANNGGAGPQCAGPGTPWTVANGGGFQLETNSAWPGTDTPDGSYYAFIQNVGSLSQTFTANATGSFVFDFLAAGRNNQSFTGNAAYNVLLNGSTIFSDTTVTGQPFTARTTNLFSLVFGNVYTLTFQGISTGPDNTAYIDAVSLRPAGVPEPATWITFLLGFGAVGLAVRRRRRGAVAFTA